MTAFQIDVYKFIDVCAVTNTCLMHKNLRYYICHRRPNSPYASLLYNLITGDVIVNHACIHAPIYGDQKPVIRQPFCYRAVTSSRVKTAGQVGFHHSQQFLAV